MRFELCRGDLPPIEEVVRYLERREETGCFAVFTGVVRGISKSGERVVALYYEANEGAARRAFEKIVGELEKKYGIHDALLYHKLGKAYVGDRVMYVAVSARGRAEAFAALRELVDRVKREVPIWKKEITERGEYWVEE